MKTNTTIKRENGNDIKIFAKTIEDSALAQIKQLGEFEAYRDSKIRIMPDCHAGSGCTIGTTMTINDKITPNLVGVDIGCGMLTIRLAEKDIDLNKLDRVINNKIPHGFDIHTKQKADFDFSKLIAKGLNLERARLSLGTLGGGNHFIEVGKDSKDCLYLVIHSGSRNIGAQVAKCYQDLAISDGENKHKILSAILITKLKREGREKEIDTELKKINTDFNKDLAYLVSENFRNYVNDMAIMQKYASMNRFTMANIILQEMGLREDMSFETMHNYIDFRRRILRKGAISAERGEKLLVPINMRDGSIIGIGKGNADWNYSAPHGAGRLMGRKEAMRNLQMDEFKEQMKDIYSTSVLPSTLDEAPNAYKPMEEILECVKDTIDIIDIIKPIYNFKAH